MVSDFELRRKTRRVISNSPISLHIRYNEDTDCIELNKKILYDAERFKEFLEALAKIRQYTIKFLIDGFCVCIDKYVPYAFRYNGVSFTVEKVASYLKVLSFIDNIELFKFLRKDATTTYAIIDSSRMKYLTLVRQLSDILFRSHNVLDVSISFDTFVRSVKLKEIGIEFDITLLNKVNVSNDFDIYSGRKYIISFDLKTLDIIEKKPLLKSEYKSIVKGLEKANRTEVSGRSIDEIILNWLREKNTFQKLDGTIRILIKDYNGLVYRTDVFHVS